MTATSSGGRSGRGGRGSGPPTISLPVAQLIEDSDIYPRHAVDEQFVSQLVLALRAGATLPPPVIDGRTSRIVDGWHRVRAYRRFLGATAVIDCIVMTFDSEASLKLYAVSANAQHGRKLDRIDQARSVLILEEAGVDERRIAVALNIPADRVRTLRIRVAYADQSNGSTVPQTIKVVLKRPIAHLAGQHLTPEQVVVQQSMPGTSFLLLCRQLRDAATFNFLNPRDARLWDALDELVRVLTAWLATHPRPGDDDENEDGDEEEGAS